MTKRHSKISMRTNWAAVKRALETGNNRKTAGEFNVDPAKIIRWLQMKDKIENLAKKSPEKRTVHAGPKLKNPNLEDSAYGWAREQRFSEIVLSTMDIIIKSVSLNPKFKEFVGRSIS